jgi:hypothetical protein
LLFRSLASRRCNLAMMYGPHIFFFCNVTNLGNFIIRVSAGGWEFYLRETGSDDRCAIQESEKNEETLLVLKLVQHHDTRRLQSAKGRFTVSIRDCEV